MNAKVEHPFGKHISELKLEGKSRKSVSFTAKVIYKNEVGDNQFSGSNNFSFGLCSLVNNDPNINDMTCVMRGTFFNGNKLCVKQVLELEKINRSMKVGGIYTFFNCKINETKNVPVDIANIVNHDCQISLDISHKGYQGFEPVIMEDISSDEEDETPPPLFSQCLSGPKLSFDFLTGTKTFGKITTMVINKNSNDRAKLANSAKKLMETGDNVVFPTIYGTKNNDSDHIIVFAMAKNFCLKSIRNVCAVCHISQDNRMAICCIVRFYEKQNGKTGFESYVAKIHKNHINPRFALN